MPVARNAGRAGAPQSRTTRRAFAADLSPIILYHISGLLSRGFAKIFQKSFPQALWKNLWKTCDLFFNDFLNYIQTVFNVFRFKVIISEYFGFFRKQFPTDF